MFHNYFFLKRLVRSLDEQIQGLHILECYSQNKDELILVFGNGEREFYIKALLEPRISLIDFPRILYKARKNYADLFEETLDKKALSIHVFQFERSFQILLEDDYSLVFKMHGSRSNILLCRHNKVISIFRTVLSSDKELDINHLNQDITINQETFDKAMGNPKAFLPALGKEVNAYLASTNYFNTDLKNQWAIMQDTLNQLDNNPIRIYQSEKPVISLFELKDKLVLETMDPLKASTEYFGLITHYFFVTKEKEKEIKKVNDEIKRAQNYISQTEAKRQQILSNRSYEEIANIIMANLYNIPQGQKVVSLNDFYANTQIDIKLNRQLTPQKNAEVYYRKAKNQKRELAFLDKNAANKKEKLARLIKLKSQIEEINSIKQVRELTKNTTSIKKTTPLPYHQFEFEGFDILVGKNAVTNDTLTLKVAKKNDLWLHAKDVSGSHVVIRRIPGKKTPISVIERAAELAAWYSKRKSDTLCPVIYTPKKYVRKRKGDPAGAMVVEREEVLMVVPKGST